jgi:lipopolysaccharide export system permease protein
LKELIPQFLSAMIVICSIIVVSQLVRLSDVLVAFGISLENVFLPFIYTILPFLSLTIPMGYLFAVVLSFGRLSADGEYPALLAAGFPLRRAALPVMLIAVGLYGVAAASALNLEAWGRREMVQFLYRKTQTELDNLVRYKMQAGVFLEDFLGYVLYAEKISPDRTRFENVMLAPRGSEKNSNFTVLAPSGRMTGTVEGGDLRLLLENGIGFSSRADQDKAAVMRFQRAEIDLLRIFHEQILGADAAEDDYRSYRPRELILYIDSIRDKVGADPGLYRRARYLFHQRIASPFAVVTFALFGLTLGVSDPRRGKSMGYVGAIGTIISGYIFMMIFKWLAEQGYMPVPVAAWMPNLILFVFGAFLLYQKNRLPPSEGTLAWENLPLVGRR